jgi:hypothetical protein
VGFPPRDGVAAVEDLPTHDPTGDEQQRAPCLLGTWEPSGALELPVRASQPHVFADVSSEWLNLEEVVDVAQGRAQIWPGCPAAGRRCEHWRIALRAPSPAGVVECGHRERQALTRVVLQLFFAPPQLGPKGRVAHGFGEDDAG